MEQNRVSLVNFGLKLVGVRRKLCVFGGENVIFALMNYVVSLSFVLAFLPRLGDLCLGIHHLHLAHATMGHAKL